MTFMNLSNIWRPSSFCRPSPHNKRFIFLDNHAKKQAPVLADKRLINLASLDGRHDLPWFADSSFGRRLRNAAPLHFKTGVAAESNRFVRHSHDSVASPASARAGSLPALSTIWISSGVRP